MLGIKEIKEILPHRYPFLLVDRIIELSEKRAVGLKNVTINEPFFQGHYPEHPVMPGVLIAEAVAQVGAILIMKPCVGEGMVPYLAGIDKLRYRRPVYPGDQLIIEVDMLSMKARIGKMKAKVFVDGELAVEGTMMFALVKGKE
ncbi:MAG: 3-hydroxyacyl-ACP dehydratase FabZ [Candidatus Xenobiia bacterium LiM19]